MADSPDMNLVFALLLLACGPGQTGQSQVSGVYGNVAYSDETGDAGGFEVALDGERSSGPTVTFTICEGGCYGGETWPVAISGDRIAFTVVHEGMRSDGAVWREAEHYEGTFEGDVLTLRSPQFPGQAFHLPRITDPEPGRTARLGGAGDPDRR